MARIIRSQLSPAERAALDNAIALETKNAANIDYIAMMSDVEIPTEDEEVIDGEQEV